MVIFKRQLYADKIITKFSVSSISGRALKWMQPETESKVGRSIGVMEYWSTGVMECWSADSTNCLSGVFLRFFNGLKNTENFKAVFGKYPEWNNFLTFSEVMLSKS